MRNLLNHWCRWPESNRRPTDYEVAGTFSASRCNDWRYRAKRLIRCLSFRQLSLRNYRARPPSIRQLFAYFLISLALISPAHASDYYFVFGADATHFVNAEKLWHGNPPMVAQGYDSTANEKSNGWHIGAGRRLTSGFYALGGRVSLGSVELAYHDHGRTSSFAGYPYDEGTGPSCQIAWPCTPTQWVYHHGKARSISLTVLPEIAWGDFALFSILGVDAFKATFSYSIANEEGDPMARDFSSENSWSAYGLTGVAGLGIRNGDISLSVRRYLSLEARAEETGSWQHLDVIGLTYRSRIKLF